MGEKWCSKGRHHAPIENFGKDRSRHGGLDAHCLPCRRVKVRKCQKGRVSPFRGRTHTTESRRQMSLARMGNKNAVGHIKSPAQLAVSRDGSKSRGAKNVNWKGGITPVIEALRRSPEYASWRTAVFKRDNYTCRSCGDDTGGNLEAHHIEPWATTPALRFDVSNGLTLCEPCHVEEHTGKPRIRTEAANG